MASENFARYPAACCGERHVRPAWALTRRCKSSPDEATRREGNHNGVRVTERGKEVGNEPASRRTETG